MMDHLLATFRQWDESLTPKYKRWHIAPAKDGHSENFVRFRPKREFLRVEIKLPKSPETDAKLQESGLDLMPYKGKYRIRLTKADLAKHEEFIIGVLRQAFDENREE